MTICTRCLESATFEEFDENDLRHEACREIDEERGKKAVERAPIMREEAKG